MGTRVGPVLLAAMLLVPATGFAQYAHEPFFENSREVRLAHVTDLMDVRLAALEAATASGELPEEMAEQAESLLEEDLPRIAGSLFDADESLLEDLIGALEELEEAVETGDATVALPEVRRARELVSRAGAALQGQDDGGPPVVAARMARLLLGEPGVAEGYEEAVAGERWEYTLGWASLQVVDTLWRDHLASLEAPRGDEVTEALEELHALLPQALPPEELSGDPEEGEEPAHRIVALLEGITDANLYPDRVAGQLARHAQAQVEEGCRAFAESRDDLALELLHAAAHDYGAIAGTLGMLMPEAHERVVSAFAALGIEAGEDEEEEEEEEEEEGEGEDSADAVAPLTGAALQEACGTLGSGLSEVAAFFGG